MKKIFLSRCKVCFGQRSGLDRFVIALFYFAPKLIFPVFSYLRFGIDGASARIRSGGPAGDQDMISDQLSLHIPLSLKALDPVADHKIDRNIKPGKKVLEFFDKIRLSIPVSFKLIPYSQYPNNRKKIK
jgi:hypothetical protein